MYIPPMDDNPGDFLERRKANLDPLKCLVSGSEKKVVRRTGDRRDAVDYI